MILSEYPKIITQNKIFLLENNSAANDVDVEETPPTNPSTDTTENMDTNQGIVRWTVNKVMLLLYYFGQFVRSMKLSQFENSHFV